MNDINKRYAILNKGIEDLEMSTRVYKKFLDWQRDIYESNRLSWTREDDIDLLYINRLLNLKSRTKKTIPHITLKSKPENQI